MNSTPPTRSPRKRSWLATCLAAVAVVVLALIALPLFVNADAYRPGIAAALTHATGRQVTLGKIHFRILPTPLVVADGLQIGNAKDFPAASFLSAESVRARVSAAALLRDKFLVTSVEIDQPALRFENDAAGRNNFTFAASVDPHAEIAGGAADAASHNFEFSPTVSISFREADVSLTEIPSASAQPFEIFAAHNLNVDVADFIAPPNEPASWSAQAKLDGLRVDLAALAAPIVVATGHASLTHGTLYATFRAQAAAIADVKGTLRIANIARSTASFQLSTPELDAPALLAALRKLPESAAGNSPLAAFSALPSNELIAEGRITADRIDWSPYVGGNASAQIRFYSDRTELWPASVTFYGGALQLTARTDASQRSERYSTNIQIRTLDLSRLLAQGPPALRGKISGLADLDLELLGSAGGAWQKVVTGNGHFSIRDGKLPGPRLHGTLGSLASAAGLNETPFKQISGDITIATGRAGITQGVVESSFIAATFAGGYTLADQSLDLSGVAKISPARLNTSSARALLGSALQNKAAEATLPFTIRGAISDPVVSSGRAALHEPQH